MMGLDSAMLLLASLGAGTSMCASVAPASVEITFANNPPVEIRTLSRKQLARMPTDTQFSHQPEEAVMVNGVTLDQTTPKYQIDYEATVHPETGSVCLRVDHVAITIEYAPQIYIASEYRAGTCLYDRTLSHELRHVDTDVLTITDFLPQMKGAVENMVGEVSARELRDIADIEPAKATLADSIRRALMGTVSEMHKVALLRQRQIDTREEYLRLARSCR